MELLADKTYSYSTENLTKNITIIANEHTLNMDGITVKANGSLTIKNAKVNVSTTGFKVEANGSLTLDNVKATTSVTLVNNSGTTNVTGGEIATSFSTNTHLLSNAKNATLAVNGTKITLNQGTLLYNFGTATLSSLTVDGASTTLVNVGAHGSITTIDGGNYLLNRVLSTNITAVPGFQENAAVINVKNGNYETASTAFDVKYGMKLNVTGGTITSKDRGISMADVNVTVSGGTLTSNGATIATIGNGKGNLTVTGGTLKSVTSYPLHFYNSNITYAISGGTFEAEVEDRPAVMIDNLGATIKDGKANVVKAYQGILTGGKYLNNIIAKVTVAGGNYDVTDQLVAEGYTVKEEVEGKNTYKVVVSTKAEDDKKPAAKPEEQAPNTYDAGLVYMGLALSAIGASVVSVRKLRNN